MMYMLHIAQKAVSTCMSVQKMEELKEEEETVPQMFSTSSHLILWGGCIFIHFSSGCSYEEFGKILPACGLIAARFYLTILYKQ